MLDLLDLKTKMGWGCHRNQLGLKPGHPEGRGEGSVVNLKKSQEIRVKSVSNMSDTDRYQS